MLDEQIASQNAKKGKKAVYVGPGARLGNELTTGTTDTASLRRKKMRSC